VVEEDGVPGELVGSRTSKEEIEDTKGVIIYISLYQRKHIMKKEKRTNNDLQNNYTVN
jgi:hypothetical protein